MRPKTLLVLGAVVVALFAFIWFVERDLPTTEERKAAEDRILDLEEDEVGALELESEEGRVRIVRSGEPEEEGGEVPEDSPDREPEWRLVEPMEARADRFAVEGIVRDLVGLETLRTVDDVDPADYGLEPPRAEAVLVTRGEETRISIGDEIPGSTNRAVRVAGRDDVEIVRGGFFDRLAKDPGEWRATELFPGQRSGVDRIGLEGGEERILLARRGDGFWVESPFVDRAAEDRVNELLSAVVGLEAERFVDDPDPARDLGLEPPAAEIEVILDGDDEPFRIVLGSVVRSADESAEQRDAPGPEKEIEEDDLGEEADPDDGEESRYARVGSQIVVVADDLVELAGRPAPSWRSMSLVEAAPYRIDEVLVEDGGELAVVRDGGEWLRGEERIEHSAVQELLSALTEAEATDVGEGLAFDPAIGITLVAGEDEESVTVGRAGGIPAASLKGREVVLLLDEGTLEAVTSAVEAVRSAEAVGDDDEADGESERSEPQE